MSDSTQSLSAPASGEPRATPDAGGASEGPTTAMWVIVAALIAGGLAVFLFTIDVGDVQIRGTAEFARAAYCAAPGNQNQDGSNIPPGTFLDLIVGEPDRNPHLAGATPANFVDGVGLTCSNPPEGYVRDGLATAAQNVTADIYPLYVKVGG